MEELGGKKTKTSRRQLSSERVRKERKEREGERIGERGKKRDREDRRSVGVCNETRRRGK